MPWRVAGRPGPLRGGSAWSMCGWPLAGPPRRRLPRGRPAGPRRGGPRPPAVGTRRDLQARRGVGRGRPQPPQARPPRLPPWPGVCVGVDGAAGARRCRDAAAQPAGTRADVASALAAVGGLGAEQDLDLRLHPLHQVEALRGGDRGRRVAEVRQHGAGTVDLPEQVRVDDSPVHLGRSVLEPSEGDDGGAVDPCVDTPEGCEGTLGKGLHSALVGDVGRYSEGATARALAFRDHGAQGVPAACGQCHTRLAFGERERGRPADATRRAGHDHVPIEDLR